MNINSEMIDAKENKIYNLEPELLQLLLFDHSTNKNIIWATDIYESHGEDYSCTSEITIPKITGYNGQIIKPRTLKSKKDKEFRVKDKAEVFTPSWMCNIQNNYADFEWFDKLDVFNSLTNDNNWVTNSNKIEFSKNKKWEDYVNDLRLEISCGEAPYLVSRYDTVSGNIIPTFERIGLLDRKIRIINENVIDDVEWLEKIFEAYKSIYAYEWQGDSLLIARENLLYTFIDYYIERYNNMPSIDLLKEIATIISWNIIQMDGMKFVVPYTCKNEIEYNNTLFGVEEVKIECIGCKKNSIKSHNGIYAKTMNWKTKRPIKFVSIIGK